MSQGFGSKKSAGGGGGGGSKKTEQSRAVVPRRSTEVVSSDSSGRSGAGGGRMLAPKGYTMRVVEPAKNNDVISYARAMNADFGPKVKQLFDIEREAAIEAARTGVYIGWRCPEFTWDCQRVGRTSKCFCGHLLEQHDKYNGRSVRVPCKEGGCKCKAYAWIPARPEEVGEFWFQRRRDFDPSTWRAKCRCKHSHDEHSPAGMRNCKACGCGAFNSNFLCAACDRHWEDHETFFDTTEDRKEKKMPYGADYLPFSEIPSLRNMVLTGEDDGDMSYMNMNMAALPGHAHSSEDTTVVPYGRGGNRHDPRDRDRYDPPSSGQGRRLEQPITGQGRRLEQPVRQRGGEEKNGQRRGRYDEENDDDNDDVYSLGSDRSQGRRIDPRGTQGGREEDEDDYSRAPATGQGRGGPPGRPRYRDDEKDGLRRGGRGRSRRYEDEDEEEEEYERQRMEPRGGARDGRSGGGGGRGVGGGAAGGKGFRPVYD